MERAWFDMYDLRKRRFDKYIWIPLRACQYKTKEGEYGFTGYKCDFFGLSSVLLPIEKKAEWAPGPVWRLQRRQ